MIHPCLNSGTVPHSPQGVKGTRLTKEGERKSLHKQTRNQESKAHTSHENRTDSTVLCMAWGCVQNKSKTIWSRWKKNPSKLFKRVLKYRIMPQSNLFDENKTK